MTKKILLLTVILSLFITSACSLEKSKENILSDDPKSIWLTNFEEAIELAKTQNKSILINFTGSDWCGWCFKLRDEVFIQKEFIDFAKENLILLEIDFPKYKKQDEQTKNYTQQLAQKYGIRGFPSIIILDSEGKLLTKTGYQPGGAENYVTHIKSFIKK